MTASRFDDLPGEVAQHRRGFPHALMRCPTCKCRVTTKFGNQGGNIVAITAWCECVLMPPLDDPYTPEVPDDAKRMVPKMIPLRCSTCGTRVTGLWEWIASTRDWLHHRCYCDCATKGAVLPPKESEATARAEIAEIDRQAVDRHKPPEAWEEILARANAKMMLKATVTGELPSSLPRIGRLRHIGEVGA